MTARQIAMLCTPWLIMGDDADTRQLLRLQLLEKVCGDYFATPAGIEARKAWHPVDGVPAQ